MKHQLGWWWKGGDVEMSENLAPLLTQEELMAWLRISRSTLWRWRQEGLPTIAKGRSVRFDRTDVDRWLRNRDAAEGTRQE